MTSSFRSDSLLNYRAINADDKEILQKLHEEFFPVRYSAQFYDDLAKGVGIFNGKLFSIIVENERKEVIGFVLGQLLDYPTQCEDHDLFNSADSVSQVFYILTIGCVASYRQQGIATNLIQRCISYANSIPTCGAVYLHVIEYNSGAVKLYQKNRFQYLKTNKDFYFIDNKYYSAFVYVYYLHEYQLPVQNQLYRRIR